MSKQFKYFTLQIEILKNKETYEKVSKLLGISSVSLRNKLDAKTEWTISEIDALCSHYKMDYYELFKKED